MRYSVLRPALETLWRSYAPFGHQSTIDERSIASGFNGERRDPLSGHYLLGNGYRVFNTVLMRFQTSDSLSPFGEGGLNAYLYTGGDPVNYTDPTGHINPALALANKVKDINFARLTQIQNNRLARPSAVTRTRAATAGFLTDLPKSPRVAQKNKLSKIRKDYDFMGEKYPSMTPYKTSSASGDALDIRHFEAVEEDFLIKSSAAKDPRSIQRLAGEAAQVRQLQATYEQLYAGKDMTRFMRQPLDVRRANIRRNQLPR